MKAQGEFCDSFLTFLLVRWLMDRVTIMTGGGNLIDELWNLHVWKRIDQLYQNFEDFEVHLQVSCDFSDSGRMYYSWPGQYM